MFFRLVIRINRSASGSNFRLVTDDAGIFHPEENTGRPKSPVSAGLTVVQCFLMEIRALTPKYRKKWSNKSF
ncbi:hypothetical protein TH19_00230 [Thalassospira profundimaris]|uniref:Uncharacterized protein n=1 Tax=Thalassospira profundimaris TaxID=502049 RepID=A0A367WDJ3_9PROT|nr:hypothetical protein TH19_00230 [Thalassospira profundimaris]